MATSFLPKEPTSTTTTDTQSMGTDRLLPFRHRTHLLAEAVAEEKSNEWTAPETLVTAGVADAAVWQVASELIVAVTVAEEEPRAEERSLYVTVNFWSLTAVTDVAPKEADSRDKPVSVYVDTEPSTSAQILTSVTVFGKLENTKLPWKGLGITFTLLVLAAETEAQSDVTEVNQTEAAVPFNTEDQVTVTEVLA